MALSSGYAQLTEPALLPSVALEQPERHLAAAGTALEPLTPCENGCRVLAEAVAEALGIRTDIWIPHNMLETEPDNRAGDQAEEKVEAWDLKGAWRSASRLFRVLVLLIPAGMAVSALMASPAAEPARKRIEPGTASKSISMHITTTFGVRSAHF